jgi:outer membrane protein with beta-barrel domain
MKKRALFTCNALVLLLLASAAGASAQEHDAPKLEIGVQYSLLSVDLPDFGGTEHAPGVGARVTYNLTDYFAVEAEGNLSPANLRSGYTTGGASQQMQFGAKVGKRWRRFGLFAKVRPGFVSFAETLTPLPVVSGGATNFVFDRERKTHFSTDVGGVLEFYPSRRILTRFDVGDTMIRYPSRDNPSSFTTTPPPRLPAELRHNLQVTAGIGFRF